MRRHYGKYDLGRGYNGFYTVLPQMAAPNELPPRDDGPLMLLIVIGQVL